MEFDGSLVFGIWVLVFLGASLDVGAWCLDVSLTPGSAHNLNHHLTHNPDFSGSAQMSAD